MDKLKKAFIPFLESFDKLDPKTRSSIAGRGLAQSLRILVEHLIDLDPIAGSELGFILGYISGNLEIYECASLGTTRFSLNKYTHKKKRIRKK